MQQALKILQTTVGSTFKWHPKEVWAQLQSNWVSDIQNIPYKKLVTGFQTLKHDGFTGISFDMVYYMDTPFGNDLKTLLSYDLSIIDAWIYSPSNYNLETMLKAINEAGLEAYVRAVIYISKKYQKEHGFSGSWAIEPINPSGFFDNYTNLWLEIVPILNKYDVKLITPFTECDRLEKYSYLIKRMYTRLSEVFHGECGFEEATHTILSGDSTINSTPIKTASDFARVVGNFDFWDWEDSQGRPMRLEYSAWIIAPVETQTDQRVSVIERMSKEFWSLPVNYYRSKYPDNPQMWGEIGARDIDGYVLGPDYFYSLPSRTSDEQERSDVIYAVLNASKKLGIDKINIWSFLLADNAPNWKSGNGLNTGFEQPISPAYRVIRAIIGSN